MGDNKPLASSLRHRPKLQFILDKQHATIYTSHRYFSDSTTKSEKPSIDSNTDIDKSIGTTTTSNKKENHGNDVVYEGPFASLTTRLKRVSITSAFASLIGVPSLILFQMNGGGSGAEGVAIPAMGQIAVGGTAILAACGSTAALSFCFSPYIHKLEWCKSQQQGAEEKDKQQDNRKMMIATTQNILSMKVETKFDPMTDVTHPTKTFRPFCNFLIKDAPMYVHPELIHDSHLRTLLVGKQVEEDDMHAKPSNDKQRLKDDDEFL